MEQARYNFIMKKLISIVTPCFNEEENIQELVLQIAAKMSEFPNYDYEHIVIDNDSVDQTRPMLRELAANDKNLKLIFNTRNFGHIRSPVHGLLQARGDAVILMASDFQDPISLIGDFIKAWEEGYKVAMAVKSASDESFVFYNIRRAFYSLMNRISDVKLVKNYTGTGLYDRLVVKTLGALNDPYPYFRGLIPELGFKSKQILFHQPGRRRGLSKNNFFTLYDMAMAGIVSYSRLPLRLVTLLGFLSSLFFFSFGVIFFIAKFIYWEEIRMGIAPLVIGFGFFASLQLIILGFIGEYVGYLLNQVQGRPLVIEAERINFDVGSTKDAAILEFYGQRD